MQVRKQQLELDMEKQTDSKYEKEYIKSAMLSLRETGRKREKEAQRARRSRASER